MYIPTPTPTPIITKTPPKPHQNTTTQVFLDHLPEGMTARDLARIFTRLRRPAASPSPSPSPSSVATTVADTEEKEGGAVAAATPAVAAVVPELEWEGGKVDAVVVVQAGSRVRRLLPKHRARGADPLHSPRAGACVCACACVCVCVLASACPAPRVLACAWVVRQSRRPLGKRYIDPLPHHPTHTHTTCLTHEKKTAVIQLGDRATYDRALSDDVRIFGIVWQVRACVCP